MTTSEVAKALGLTPQAIRYRVSVGTLTPVATLGRTYVFNREHIEKLAAKAGGDRPTT